MIEAVTAKAAGGGDGNVAVDGHESKKQGSGCKVEQPVENAMVRGS
ncbi:MAG: hypothetical protein RLZZ50_1446 [Verrucomicrobiota bacterium]